MAGHLGGFVVIFPAVFIILLRFMEVFKKKTFARSLAAVFSRKTVRNG